MRGLFFEDGRATYREDLPEPEPRAGECRVRVELAGICATDLALLRGYMGFTGVPGHEFVGTALDGPHAGRRVVGDINAGCGRCPRCEEGDSRHCPDRTVLGILNHSGCFAERIVLPEGNLHPVPDGVPPEVAVFAEPIAAACEILEQIRPPAGDRVLIAGDGRLGLLIARVLEAEGLRVTLHGRHPERADLLGGQLEWLGRLDAPGIEPFDIAVEATGHPEVLPRLLPLVRPRGTIVLKTTSEAAPGLDLSLAVIHELTLLGSRCGPFSPALARLADGTVDPRPLIVETCPLERGVEALHRAGEPGILKVLLATEPTPGP